MSSAFDEQERRFLTSGVRALGRIATVGSDGTLHVVPTGWTYNRELDTIDATGRSVERTKKYRDVDATGRAAIVIDGVDDQQGWHPWAVEVSGPAEAVAGPPALIRIHPARVRSWGLNDRAVLCRLVQAGPAQATSVSVAERLRSPPQPKSMAENPPSLPRLWRAVMRRTVPDFDRITSDWVMAPRRS